MERNRREVLTLSAAAAIGSFAGTGAMAQQVKWSEGTEAAKVTAPANACDCHHHIYGSQYEIDPRSTLRPGDASVEDYRSLQKRIGTSRNVVMQPSTYGTRNAPTLDAVAAFGPTARAVVVVDTNVTDAELKRMHEQGARGIRFNLAQSRGDDAGDNRTAIQARQRFGLAHPDQRAGGNDRRDHADLAEGAVADRVRPPCPHPAAGRGQPPAVLAGAGADRQGTDLGQAVRRLRRYQDRAAGLRRLDRGRAGLCQGQPGAAGLGQRLAAPVRARQETERRGAVRPARGVGSR